MCSYSTLICGQSNKNSDKQVRLVFNQIISVYGSAKPAPELKVDKFTLPASYIANPKPMIKVDLALYKLCQSFGKDSLNALAVVLSHELTHYYNDHTFCSDYAFANFKSNAALKSKIGQSSYNARIEKESEADIKGFFYTAAAGFQQHGLQGLLIGKVYAAYKLADIQKGYPSKQERIVIAQNAEKTATQLYEHFKNGLTALENKQYDPAIELFNKANSQVPFRENWNNIGVAYARKALALKVGSKAEIENPNRFLYPLEVENKIKNEIRIVFIIYNFKSFQIFSAFSSSSAFQYAIANIRFASEDSCISFGNFSVISAIAEVCLSNKSYTQARLIRLL